MPMPLFVSLIGVGGDIDPFFSDVTLLLHCDSLTTDDSPNPKSITNDGASIDTSIKRFGTGGLRTSSTTFLSIADSPDFDLLGDFTIQASVRWDGTPGETSFFGQSEGGGNFVKKLFFGWNAAGISTTMFIHYGTGFSNNSTVAANAQFSPVATTWYDLAWVRSGNNFSFWVDGAQLGTTVVDSIGFPQVASPLTIGRDPENYRQFTGVFDEIRFTRRSRSIVPLTTPFPDR